MLSSFIQHRRKIPDSVLPIRSPLPWRTHNANIKSSPSELRLPKRFKRVLLLGLFVFILLFLFSLRHFNGERLVLLPPANETDLSLPPLYPQYNDYERNLPQHDLSLSAPEGKYAKFLWMPAHATGSGWGNIMQEVVLNAHLAFSSKRSFVFDNYTWNQDGSDFSEYNGKLIPSKIPMSAIISGPIVGGSYGPQHSDVPRAVTKEYFYSICPERTRIHKADVHAHISNPPTAGGVLSAWVDRLNSTEERCVEVDRESSQLFDIWIFGSSKLLLDVWPSLSQSPILTQFAWSPLILSAFQENRAVFEKSSLFSSLPSIFAPDRYATIPGLIALHIRRGDFVEHCGHLASWQSTFSGFNAFPELPDKFAALGEDSPENTEHYMKHCFPSIEQIVDKVLNVKTSAASRGKALRRVYIMTNGPKTWVDELKGALRGASSWDQVGSSRDLVLTREQKYVAQAVDTYVAQRAEYFIGNGFSSLTGNVVMLKMANGYPPESIRHW